MLLDNLRLFCERRDNYEKKFAGFLRSPELSEDDRDRVLELLRQFLMEPTCSEDVAEHFPQYLLVLLVDAIQTRPEAPSVTPASKRLHRLNCVVLGTLVPLHPDVLGLALDYFEVHPSPFGSASDDAALASKRHKGNNVPFLAREVSALEIVTASHNILRAAPEHFKHKWNWSEFYEYLNHKDDNVKWIALKCVGIVLKMSESSRSACASILIKNPDAFLIDRSPNESIAIPPTVNQPKELDEIVSKSSKSLVSIAGVLLPVFNVSQRPKFQKLITVPSMEANLRSIVLAVASRRSVCLQGPVGCGKTALVEYLANITGHDRSNFVKVQLGDQTDSKMLLGNYRCTDIPGEFVWQPGVLTQAVVHGKWLLLEDIDSSALDVASVLGNLMETGTLAVPGYRETIYAKTGFQLFLTQRLVSTNSGYHRRSTGSSNILEKHWFSVHMNTFSRSELVVIVTTLFPALTTVATRMVDVFALFSTGHNVERSVGNETLFIDTGRTISTRDLIKWCTRAIVDLDVSSPDSGLKILQDAIDIFCCSVSDQTHRLKLATAIGNTLGIVKTKAEYFCNAHKPSINFVSNIFVAGRAKIERKKCSHARVEQTKTKFSFTRPSATLIERVATCVGQNEPVLLVGETGTGKTSSVQYLARSTGRKLVVINMNQQSESADLLGGYKPVDFKFLITPTREEFEMLFRSYFALEPNKKFLEHVATCYKDKRWKTLVGLMHHSAGAAVKRLRTKIDEDASKIATEKRTNGDGAKRKRENVANVSRDKTELLRKWEKLLTKLEKLKIQTKSHYSLAFAFIEGSLTKALQEGHWVLLDEINLASSETLECLSGLLEGSTGSLSLLERGDSEYVKRHPDFTIFACMNPATDVGKKELPIGLRNRFTEFYVDELTEKTDLQLLVNSYIGDLNLSTSKQEAIVKMYLNLRKEAVDSLYDGTGHKPHYSLRTLCRALTVASTNPCGNVLRSLHEAFCMSFLTQLDHASYPTVENMITRAIIDAKMIKSVLGSPIPKPRCTDDGDYINFEGYWIAKGENEPRVPKNYILTNSVRRNLRDLVRVVSIGKIPILLQGDTSVGKTSLITYLAKASGHNCVRINNHEHTDLQEYVGSYVADETGKLLFKEGILVEAMRRGNWIILDELNLAPSDVLEALNRVLDDNRELFITETQRIVKAHPNFMLFATQNPPGLYGGRKVLSRAFRNRFVELHFDEIPSDELKIILHERCNIPESYCKQIINVMTDLQLRRKTTAAFQGKHGFMTLRDLFRWGERYRLAPDVGPKLYDWSQHLADEGYLVLAAKVRKSEEAREIRFVIKKHLKRDVDPTTLFTLDERTSSVTKSILENIINRGISGFKHVVWTYHMRRMAVLVKKSCQFKEPVLLVGETGGGKTTICQLMASMSDQKLWGVNCHMHTESSDFLGNLRPVRDHSDPDRQKLFEWVDGPLITAMQKGDLFLADEISLADDSVLERLNSLLEPERSLLLAEKSVDSPDSRESDCVITAHENFHFIGTMNPGGDYGKKELSPALRNRFTEIWCEGCAERCDLQAIIEHNLNSINVAERKKIATSMLNFVDWLKDSEVGKRFTVSIRDILTWVNFVNACTGENEVSRLSIAEAYLHGAFLTYIDGLGSGLTGMESVEKLDAFRKSALKFLESQAIESFAEKMTVENSIKPADAMDDVPSSAFGISPFFIAKGPRAEDDDRSFSFTAPTTKSNTLKLLRALQLKKPLLLEGSPGVGKTSLVAALARASGHAMLRINLSDQTDVSDLFGADLPLEGGKAGQFGWKDGPFLRALRSGDWILLDELNLASQSVLEGLNACLDHRGEIYIPELGRTFSIKTGTKLFACQNPVRQGGARRGLPKSFLNRFTQVYVDALTNEDLKLIATKQFSMIPEEILEKIVRLNSKLSEEAGICWAFEGSPWEMNLRDITRLCEAIVSSARRNMDGDEIFYNPGNAIELIYVDRMRTSEDRRKVREIYEDIFDVEKYRLPPRQPIVHVTGEKFYVGDVELPRNEFSNGNDNDLLVLRDQTAVLRSLARCVEMNWMPIIVGGPGCGKSSVVRVLAQLTGQRLRSVVVNSAMDTTEILGGFEQTDYNRHLEQLLEDVETLLIENLKSRLNVSCLKEIAEYHSSLEKVQKLSHGENQTLTMTAETDLFLRRTDELSKLVSSMKTLKDARNSELEAIETRLKDLENHVKEDKCLNAGGKFEWVDSTLVKCLQEGSWLLLDQVNLCSPAVLDRLNGLLEPGGVLTIGERGVGKDGNILTIKPHKNFRLFLTMDPRYGEISRAMRNRGVEIYLLGNRENCRTDKLDAKSMLHNIGLTKSNHQDALLDIHEKMFEDDFTDEKLSIVHLLHSAFLIIQQTIRGFSADEAFSTSCVDVYLKSRYVQQPSTKQRLRAVIDDAIIRHDVNSNSESPFDLSLATWSLRNLRDNFKLTIVEQQGFLLDAAIKMWKTYEKNSLENVETNAIVPTCKYFDEFLGTTEIGKRAIVANVREILPYLLLNFYEGSSTSDAGVRNRWLLAMLPSENPLRDFGERSESLTSEIAAFGDEFSCSALPWDSGQLPNVANDENSSGRANRLALILYLHAMNVRYGGIIGNTNFDKEETRITVTGYSNAVYHGKLTSHLKNQPLITNFVMFIAQLDDCINRILHESCILLGSEDYVELRRNFNWLRRFHDVGRMILIDKSENSRNANANIDEVTLMLRVHYKWLIKFVKKCLSIREKVIFTEHCNSVIDRLVAMIASIDDSVKSVHDPFRKIAKKLKNHLVVPTPFTSKISIDVYALANKLSTELSPCQVDRAENTLKKDLKIICLEDNDTRKIRDQLLLHWQNIYDERNFDETDVKSLRDVEESIERSGLALRTPFEMSEVLLRAKNYRERDVVEISANVQLWPVYDYAFYVLANNLQRKICDETATNAIPEALEKLSKISSVPINVVALINSILSNPRNSNRRKRLTIELFPKIEEFARRSCAFRDSKSILHWEGIAETDMEKSVTKNEDTQPDENPIYGPVLLKLISELILNKSKTVHEKSILSTAKLGTYRSQTNQLKTLNAILWRNSVSLNSADYDVSKNDFSILKSCVKDFLTAVERMENEKSTLSLMRTEMEKLSIDGRKELETKFRRDYEEPLNELKRKAASFADSDESRNNDVIERGKTWILLGYVRVFLFANPGYIDPIQKISLKLRYIDEDIDDCKKTIYVAALNSRIVGDRYPSPNTNPRYLETEKCLERLSSERDALKNSKAVRPSTNEFATLAKETLNFRNTLGSYDVVEKITNELSNAVNELKANNVDVGRTIVAANDAVQKSEIWQESLERFRVLLEKKFIPNYPDIVVPVVSATSQLRHGVRILTDETRRLACLKNLNVNGIDVRTFVHNIVSFPTVGRHQEDLLRLVEVCTSRQTREFMNRNIAFTNDGSTSLAEQFRMAKIGLMELYNHITVDRQFGPSLWRDLNGLLQQIVLIWQRQRNENEKRAADEDSMYRNKVKIHGNGANEDEEIAMELRNLFPTTRDEDFTDIEETNVGSLERVETRTNDDVGERYAGLITDNDVDEVREIHSRLVRLFVDAPWLEKRTSTEKRDYAKPLIQRYNTFGMLLDKVLPALDDRLSSKLHASVNFLTSVTCRTSEGNANDDENAMVEKNIVGTRKNYDFYKTPNVEETKQCLPILEAIVDRVDDFLTQWPEHPTLRSTRAIVRRIYGFSIVSPVSRFLTGVELLLVKMKEWEENAHTGVSLVEHSFALTRQIINWRKLELACWKDCLNVARERLESKASKWWFFFYALVESYVANSTLDAELPDDDGTSEPRRINEPVTVKKLTELLEAFVNGSSLVEFRPRLNLIMTFHSHVYRLNESRERDQLLAVLWNVYNYYEQYNREVDERMKALKAPIEKKLRDFVKIARWNDINYWSVKETVEKTHRTLHKFIREYETGLKVPAVVCLLVKASSYNDETNIGEWDRSKERDYVIDPRDFVLVEKTSSVGKIVEEKFAATELISRTENLFVKSRRLCERTIISSSYPGLRTSLENLMENVVARSSELKKMDVDRTLPKPKQKSHARGILQQKRLALADYFKTLSHVGLSYRTGNLAWKNRQNDVVDLTIPPVDLIAGLKHFRTDKPDAQMLAEWNGCDRYYYKSLIKLTALAGASTKTKTDLGPANMERCFGYSAHVMLLANRQKRIVADSFGSYFSLRKHVENLTNIDNCAVNIPRDKELHDCAKSLKKLLMSLEIGLEQLELYLQACPADPGLDANDEILMLETSDLAIVNSTKGDPIWESANSILRQCLKSLAPIIRRFNGLYSEDVVVLTPVHYKFFDDTSKILETVKSLINEFAKIFGNADNTSHPILETVEFLQSGIDDWIEKFLLMGVSESEVDNSGSQSVETMEAHTANVECLVKTILLVIQQKYKECCSDDSETAVPEIDENIENLEEDEDEEDDKLDENAFHGKLVECLEKDVKDLRLDDVRQQLVIILKMTASENPSDATMRRTLLVRCLPLLRQYLLFAQFYLNEQVAAFRVTCKWLYLQLNVFLDLATNGFCVPKDLDLEEGEGETGQDQGKTQNGMGLGDGEGEKDVSDRIESEDQLEDARPANEDREKKEDDDCKEEDKGIEMSEDFDSKLQDVDKNDGEDDEEKSENEDDEDLDKQMGDTEKGADALDEEIWGDDKEESENETGEDREEDNQGKGEEVGEKEMTAKDDSKKKDANDEREDNDDRAEKEKKEINEMEEPETNDDQIDPYHGNHEPMPEPEALDLPDDINLDGEEANDDKPEGDDDNPFDIDEMKESMPPAEEKEAEEKEEKAKEDAAEDSSDDEDEEGPKDGEVKGPNEEGAEEEDQPDPEADSEAKSQLPDKNNDDEENKKDEEENADEGTDEKVAASVDEGSKEMDAADQPEVNKEGSRDKVADQPNADEQQQRESASENTQDESNNKGTGQAQSEDQETGHAGSSMQNTAPVQHREKEQRQIEKRKNPGESDENRSLVDELKPDAKKLKMIHSREETREDDGEEGADENKEDDDDSGDVDMCQHVKNSEKFDDQAMDAATKEQVRQQATNAEDEEKKKEEGEESMEVDMHRDEEEPESEETKPLKQNAESTAGEEKEKEKEKGKTDPKGTEEGQIDSVVEVDGEAAATARVDRGAESAFYTNVIDIGESLSTTRQMERKRMEVETMLSQWTYVPSTEEALTAWNCLNAVTEVAARDLSEKLRLVLEPTQATRLKGDYRTGRRINMRKIIPYIASQFRKDKIWLRRTKPSKRDYQIVLALDDSSSMADNHSKELAFESLSLISKAMGYLEVGQLSVVSFGETASVLHPLGEPFTENSGSRLIQEMRFDQTKTKVGELVDFTVDMFESQRSSTDSAKLLVVLSDGRGVFSEGLDQVNCAVRRARLADIFLVFIIVDNPLNKDSILDIRMPVFQAGKLLGIKSYMDSFPFPFYMILRDINALPGVLSDALRQWFEVVGKIDT